MSRNYRNNKLPQNNQSYSGDRRRNQRRRGDRAAKPTAPGIERSRQHAPRDERRFADHADVTSAAAALRSNVTPRLRIGSLVYEVLDSNERAVFVRRKTPVFVRGVKTYAALELKYEAVARMGGKFLDDAPAVSFTAIPPFSSPVLTAQVGIL